MREDTGSGHCCSQHSSEFFGVWALSDLKAAGETGAEKKESRAGSVEGRGSRERLPRRGLFLGGYSAELGTFPAAEREVEARAANRAGVRVGSRPCFCELGSRSALDFTLSRHMSLSDSTWQPVTCPHHGICLHSTLPVST